MGPVDFALQNQRQACWLIGWPESVLGRCLIFVALPTQRTDQSGSIRLGDLSNARRTCKKMHAVPLERLLSLLFKQCDEATCQRALLANFCVASVRWPCYVLRVLLETVDVNTTFCATRRANSGVTPLGGENPLQTPLHHASRWGNTAVVRTLLAAHASINLCDSRGNMPLHAASLLGCEAVVRDLLMANAKVDVANQSGATPLYICVYRGHAGVTAALIESSADVHFRHRGSTLLDIALKRGHTAIAKLLRKAGGRKY